jgi:tyrosinase
MEGSVPVRRAVSRLDRSAGVPQELADYAEGFQAMRELDATNPWSLEYQSAIHARDGESNRQRDDWDWCQHQNWFFLPWHRMYLRQFEKILGHLIGKPDWRLPYWDYIEADEAKWALPPEFLTPDDESNALFVAGRRTEPLQSDERDVATALRTERFEIEDPAGFGFGSGRIAQPSQFGHGQTGELEGTPHNAVHRGVGGLLGDPTTAAMDPIFWLHHASIDRTWEVWLSQDEPARANPTDGAWLNTEFTFPDPAGDATLRVRDVLDTVAIGYVYDDVIAPVLEEERRVAVDFAEVVLAGPSEPELIGASEEGVPLEPGATHAVSLQSPDQWRLAERALKEGAIDDRRDVTAAATELALGRRVLLQLEGVTATQVPHGTYGVYVNVPEGEDPADYPFLKAGLFAPFGLELATRDGHGITQSYDITEIARRLYTEGRWDPERVDVTFEAGAPVGGADHERRGEPTAGDVKVGSIRVYVE